MARPKDVAERRKRLRELERGARLRKLARNAAAAVVLVLVLAAAVYGYEHLPKERPVVHWHAKYQVWVDNKLESFANPKWDGAIYEAAHMHSPDWDVIHNEGREGDGTLGKFFALDLGGKLTADEMIVPAGANFPGDYKVGPGETLSLFLSNQVTNTSWHQVPGNPGDLSFHDGDRILLLYGNYSAGDVAGKEDAFPAFDPSQVR